MWYQIWIEIYKKQWLIIKIQPKYPKLWAIMQHMSNFYKVFAWKINIHNRCYHIYANIDTFCMYVVQYSFGTSSIIIVLNILVCTQIMKCLFVKFRYMCVACKAGGTDMDQPNFFSHSCWIEQCFSIFWLSYVDKKTQKMNHLSR